MYKKILTQHVDFAWATATVVHPDWRTDRDDSPPVALRRV